VFALDLMATYETRAKTGASEGLVLGSVVSIWELKEMAEIE
jgi:hypothetical protein